MESFDLRDTIISFSLLQIINHFKKMRTGEVIEIFGSDPSIIEDLNNLLPEMEYEIINIETLNLSRPDFRMQLRKIEKNINLKKEDHHV